MSICAPRTRRFPPRTSRRERQPFFLGDRVQSPAIGPASYDSVELITSLIYHLFSLSVLSLSLSFSRSLFSLLSSMSCSGSRRCAKTSWVSGSVTWHPATPSWPLWRRTSNQVRDLWRELELQRFKGKKNDNDWRHQPTERNIYVVPLRKRLTLFECSWPRKT